MDHIDQIKNSTYFNPIDIHFANFMADIAGELSWELLLGAALASNAVGSGAVCIDLSALAGNRLDGEAEDSALIICPKLEPWIEKLKSSPVVGAPGDYRPLILDAGNRLYLYRYWEYEHQLAQDIKKRAQHMFDQVDPVKLKVALGRFWPACDRDEALWQCMAALTAVFKGFVVIAGGPGTGKTTTIAKIIALLNAMSEDRQPDVLLAAPTGKAAARLSESMRVSVNRLDGQFNAKTDPPLEAYTIHRLLKPIPGSNQFQHNADNPLPADIVAVDEASMVDLALMAKLMAALPSQARFILVGDQDQLASVASGSVLGDICRKSTLRGFSEAWLKKIAPIMNISFERLRGHCQAGPALQDCIVQMQKSFRFDAQGGISALSRAVNQGDADQAIKLLGNKNAREIKWDQPLSSHFSAKAMRAVIKGYADYTQAKDPAEALKRFNRFQILCTVNHGPQGVEALNRIAEAALHQEGCIKPDAPWYKGRPVLITRNDYRLGLFNGDIGITWPTSEADLNGMAVFFPGPDGNLRSFAPHRLPEHDTVYAMTVHKSQGSEFNQVLLVMPEKDYPVLTRELLYTGLTRAKQRLIVWGSEAVLRTAVTRRISRSSGLKEAL